MNKKEIKEIVDKYCLQQTGADFDKLIDDWNRDMHKVISHHNAKIYITKIMGSEEFTESRKLELISLLLECWGLLYGEKKELKEIVPDYNF